MLNNSINNKRLSIAGFAAPESPVNAGNIIMP